MKMKTVDQLVQAIKTGKLKVTQANAEAVKKAWGESVIWDATFKATSLDCLPDPQGISEHSQLFEDWLVKAYCAKFASENETRHKFHLAREAILREEGL